AVSRGNARAADTLREEDEQDKEEPVEDPKPKIVTKPPKEPISPVPPPSQPKERISKRPGGPDYGEIDALVASKRYVEALRKLEPFTKTQPKAVDVWSLRGSLLMILGQNEAALVSAQRAVDIDARDIRGWKVLARAASAMKKDVRAREAADR